ncbi:unnamed protein product [Protopolystoma xenopodis]|uniref:Uncharacterized protein n=1 Tax=Protopolystoma xenopodis TaxID=117903 RepID=A0A448X8B1_9PLAT|nr:unnamed protein product [Protopolystoma xenopodis]
MAFPRRVKTNKTLHESASEHAFWSTKSGAPLPAIVLLHDPTKQLNSAKSWQERGTMQLLTGFGFRVYAIDLPGRLTRRARITGIICKICSNLLLKEIQNAHQ